ncbi:hypothetical protein [Paraburkholderia dilworthii]|uniref:hypothetical protein n=1 Tax=Paraburkholderia dilworthii TaxID=948106 RepID=UPI0004853BCF|nr:hypothetical protein [Paraburkholderia dilworthii]
MEFTVQRLHSALHVGQRLTVADANIPAFSYQGGWDSGCTLHCLAMAGALLGQLTDPSKVSSRRRGPEAAFWNSVRPYYLSGATLSELAELIRELDWNLKPVVAEGAHSSVMEFCVRELSQGHLVVVSWRTVHRSHYHAVLAIGMEGVQRGTTFEPHTLLMLDPSENEPWLSTCNARMSLGGLAAGKRSRDARYVTASYTDRVIADGAVSIRMGAAKRRARSKPP